MGAAEIPIVWNFVLPNLDSARCESGFQHNPPFVREVLAGAVKTERLQRMSARSAHMISMDRAAKAPFPPIRVLRQTYKTVAARRCDLHAQPKRQNPILDNAVACCHKVTRRHSRSYLAGEGLPLGLEEEKP
ncbi:hypothetical protein WNY61_19755 [Sulfitobacter sp. AS92]|uniref:hypothetical protein n=1 Tax=Sulfitobacter sp. AS92 TaxID=3135783 RepID=UPI003170C068